MTKSKSKEKTTLRYAVYHTPHSTHPLTLAASSWLGRNPFGMTVIDPAHPCGWYNEEPLALVRDAARYGFHATLKAPFSLAPHKSEDELVTAFEDFEAALDPLIIPSLALRQIDGFFALVPDVPVDAIQELAALAVKKFDMFRAPLTSSDMARRNPDQLTARQRAYLEEWGYPYVFEEFFFHMTLTNRVSEENSSRVLEALEEHFSKFIGKPYHVDHLALFVEQSPGANFSIHSMRRITGQTYSKLEFESANHAK